MSSGEERWLLSRTAAGIEPMRNGLVSSGVNLRIRIYIYVVYVRLILLMFNKEGFCFQKVPIYNSLYLNLGGMI